MSDERDFGDEDRGVPMSERPSADNRVYLFDGLDEAFIGLGLRFGIQNPVAVYDHEKCVQLFVKQGMTEDEACEHIEVNCLGAWIGNGTPMMVMQMPLQKFREISEEHHAEG